MMSIEVKKQNKLPLLNRERVTGYVHYDGVTPSRLDIKKELAKKINVKEGNVVVRHVYGKYGTQHSKLIAHIYNDEASMKKYEPHNLLVKNGLAAPIDKTAAGTEEKK
ncbi:MAG: hypothetical protein WC254_03125 [Candidatus Woesearchaeota archaeon]|jgi:small subunit ribosomal protein S24e